MRRIFVTGGHGFVGRAAVTRLRAAGHMVTAPGRAELDVAAGPFPVGDCDLVVHLAARSFVPDAWKEPEDFWRVNALGTVNALESCRRAGAAMVYVSGYAYGQPDALPIPESAPLRPGNPYAASKAAGEAACDAWRASFGMRVTILRVFNVYGPGQDPRFLIPTILAQVLDPAAPTVNLAIATTRRDFVHVDDVAGAIVAAAGAAEPRAPAYNVGAGRSWSAGEVVGLLQEAAGTAKPLIDRGERRTNEIGDVVADISLIARDLGWMPATPFAEGLAALVAAAR